MPNTMWYIILVASGLMNIWCAYVIMRLTKPKRKQTVTKPLPEMVESRHYNR